MNAYRAEIIGKWKAIPIAGDSVDFELNFIDASTVIITVNKDGLDGKYRYVQPDHIEFMDSNGNVEHRLNNKVTHDTLTLSNDRELTKYVKTQ
jgi:hypothetical protein